MYIHIHIYNEILIELLYNGNRITNYITRISSSSIVLAIAAPAAAAAVDSVLVVLLAVTLHTYDILYID